MTSTEKGLEGKGLVKMYHGKRVVNGIDISIKRKEIVGLLGPNGAGKTTTFYMLIGLVRPNEGTVSIYGEDITRDPIFVRARKGMNYLAQESSVFRKLTVEQNLFIIMENLDLPRHAIKSQAARLLNELGIEHLAKQKAASLSGGERRRVEISRALATNPSFMLLDEPFAGIDPLALNDIKQIISQLKAKGIGIIITDHNVRETLDICDFAHIINQGKIVESGSPDKILQSQIARNVYLGEDFNL